MMMPPRPTNPEPARGFTNSLFSLFAISFVTLLSFLGCDPTDDKPVRGATYESVALENQEDEVCGMLVRGQTAPRSQMLHRDGSRFFFCSLGDMLVHLTSPSPHGRVEALFVEVLKPEEEPMESHTGEHPWVLAEDAFYVVGVERQRIMGKPVLAYATQSDADQVMSKYPGAKGLDFSGLKAWWKAANQ